MTRMGPAVSGRWRVCAPRGRDAALPAKALSKGRVSLLCGVRQGAGRPLVPEKPSPFAPRLYFPGLHGSGSRWGSSVGPQPPRWLLTRGLNPFSRWFAGRTAGLEQKWAKNLPGEGGLAAGNIASTGRCWGMPRSFYLVPCQVKVPPLVVGLH